MVWKLGRLGRSQHLIETATLLEKWYIFQWLTGVRWHRNPRHSDRESYRTFRGFGQTTPNWACVGSSWGPSPLLLQPHHNINILSIIQELLAVMSPTPQQVSESTLLLALGRKASSRPIISSVANRWRCLSFQHKSNAYFFSFMSCIVYSHNNCFRWFNNICHNIICNYHQFADINHISKEKFKNSRISIFLFMS